MTELTSQKATQRRGEGRQNLTHPFSEFGSAECRGTPPGAVCAVTRVKRTEKLRLFDKKHGRYCCALRGSPLPHRPPQVSSLAANGAAESTTCDYAMSNEEAMRGDHFNRFSSIAQVLLQMLQQRHHDYIKTRTAAIHRTRWILSHACFPGRPPPRIFPRPPLHSSTSFSPSW